jgi:hypothetical protein
MNGYKGQAEISGAQYQTLALNVSPTNKALSGLACPQGLTGEELLSACRFISGFK